MAPTKVLVTGGCGFVGARVVQHLREKHPQWRITVTDVRMPGTDVQLPGVDYLLGDITSLSSMQRVFADTDEAYQVVFHIAGLSPPLSERYARRVEQLVFKINVTGTQNVLLAAQEAGVKALVYTSSVTAVTDDFTRSYANIDERWPLVEPNTATSYGESKAAAEKLVMQANSSTFRTCALRLAVVFGEGDYALVPTMVSCITDKNESPYRLGDGMNLWDTVYVGNVADAHILAAENLISDDPTAAGEAFFIQNNEPVSTRDFMLQIWKEYNGHIPTFQIGIPLKLAWVAGLIFEMYTWITGSPATISRGSVLDATAMRYANGGKARRILGYEPQVGLEDGLRRTCQWLYRRSLPKQG